MRWYGWEKRSLVNWIIGLKKKKKTRWERQKMEDMVDLEEAGQRSKIESDGVPQGEDKKAEGDTWRNDGW